MIPGPLLILSALNAKKTDLFQSAMRLNWAIYKVIMTKLRAC